MLYPCLRNMLENKKLKCLFFAKKMWWNNKIYRKINECLFKWAVEYQPFALTYERTYFASKWTIRLDGSYVIDEHGENYSA